MALNPAWAVDGGKVPAAMARMVAWCATGGTTGIVQPTDLRVTALATPGGGVNIAPGGAVISSNYATAGRGESYTVTNDAAEQLEIPATSSSGARTDYVILRIDDWHFDGSQEPDEPLDALYCSFQRVSSITGLTYPFVALAKITIPASTAAVTQAMISDLRTVASPRESTVIRPLPSVATDTEMELTTTNPNGEVFPGAVSGTRGPQEIDIPSWAARVQIQCTWLGVRYPNTNPHGRYWISWGDYVAGGTYTYTSDTFRFDSPAGSVSRALWIAATEQTVPASFRGTTKSFAPYARYDDDSPGKGAAMDYMSGMIWTVRFLEVADDSNS